MDVSVVEGVKGDLRGWGRGRGNGGVLRGGVGVWGLGGSLILECLRLDGSISLNH